MLVRGAVMFVRSALGFGRSAAVLVRGTVAFGRRAGAFGRDAVRCWDGPWGAGVERARHGGAWGL